MTRRIIACAALAASLAALYPLYAKAPEAVFEPAKVEFLAVEAEAQSAKLAEFLATQEGYEELQADTLKRNRVPQVGGVLAVIGQTLAEHPQKDKTKINGTALRAAGIAVHKAANYEEAQQAHAQVKEALEGKGVAGAVEHDWAQLTPMYPMMEEVNIRSAQLGRALRRPRDLDEPIRDATMLALFAVVMEHDTHPVAEPEKVGQWQKYAVTYRDSMLKVAEELRKKDTAAARTAYFAGVRACDFCHEDFRQN